MPRIDIVRISHVMMTSSNGNIFRVTGPLCGEFTGPGEFPTQRPVTRSFDVFFDLRLNKRLSKQPWGWWFETISCSLWRQCNEIVLRWMPQDLTVTQLTLLQVMDCCHQVTSHYRNHCWPRSMLPYDVTRTPWVNWALSTGRCHHRNTLHVLQFWKPIGLSGKISQGPAPMEFQRPGAPNSTSHV